MRKAKVSNPLSICFVLALGAGACRGCERDVPPPALPTDTTPTVAAPPTIDPLPPPVASDGDAGAAGAPRPSGPPASSLRACCAALRSNAASMPPPNNAYALAAAAYCDSAVASGQDRNAIVQGVRSALKGANLPGSCK
ncbi:MAG TPA: hypothetical protein VFS00_11970 [Polyangiaceae bacterium]|nr:hypothetical protein [Polyangiaceae bacterium]